jgi:hypothetical protein
LCLGKTTAAYGWLFVMADRNATRMLMSAFTCRITSRGSHH